MLSKQLALLALATSAAAQLGSLTSGLSNSCQNSATGLLTSSFASCSSILSLAGVLTASGSVITPLESWLNQVCTKSCSQSDIDSALAVVDQGCASDLSSGSALAETVRFVIANYQVEQSALCLQSTSNSTYCISQLLGDVQNSTGTDLTLTTLLGLFSNSSSSILSDLSSSTVCTDCNHGLVAALAPIENGTLSQPLGQICGSTFANGQIPSTVALKSNSSSTSTGSSSNGTTSASSSSPTGGASSLGVGGIAIALLSVVIGALTLV